MTDYRDIKYYLPDSNTINWQAVQTTGFTAVAGNGYACNTSGGTFTATLPASPSVGDTVVFKDYGDDFGTEALTIGRNGENIQGAASDSSVATDRAAVTLTYVDATKGWLYMVESNVADLGPSYITATGGTITTVDTDYKVHTFTGDGTFTVTAVGNAIGGTTVDYLVVAGGGGGGNAAGAGGAGGGYRESYPNPATGGLAVSTSPGSYAITVGDGAAANTGGPGHGIARGSDSIFSTITSTGGGGGSGATGAGEPYGGMPGGSGGGGNGSYSGPTNPQAAGTGNSPPVSPPQGNDGSAGTPTTPFTGAHGGGGGGAGFRGGNNDPTGANPRTGGYGVYSTINGSPVSRGGGGSGSGPPVVPGPSVHAAHGGGGKGGVGGTTTPPTSPNFQGEAGTPNTGGGGGGGTEAMPGGAAGPGLVIVRYKFQ